MNSDVDGMFGPRGMLVQMETEKDTLMHQPTNKVAENFIDSSTSDDGEKGQEQQQSCEMLVQLNNDNELNNSSLTSDVDQAAPVIRLTDLPPMEAAFSIEEIRNAILSPLDPEDLLKCRLVSSLWLRMATNGELLRRYQERIRIKINLSKKNPVAVTVWGQKRGWKDLTDTLDGLGSTPFPASAKLDLYTTISRNNFMKYFDCYGFIVTSLHVTFQTKEKGQRFIYQRDLLLEFVTKLLTEQMPSLKTFYMKLKKNGKFAGAINPQLLDNIKNGSYFAGKQNQSLSHIYCDDRTPCEIIDAVCCLAPKVKDLFLYDLIGFYAKNKHRLYLLETLHFEPSLKDWDEVYALEEVIDDVEKLYLKELDVEFYHVSKKPEVWPHLATLLKKTFELSCNSLEKLILNKMYFLPGTVLPPMPNVKELLLSSDDDIPEWSWFPQGISIVTTFPKLHSIYFFIDDIVPNVKNFLSLCKNEEVASVKEIITHNTDVLNKVLQKRFPNAIVTE